MQSLKYLIVILGQTATGKTDLAIFLAKYFSTSILSADSRQFYKEMTIGTAKPSRTELENTKHFFIDTHSVSENYSAGQYEKDALSILNEVFLEKNISILAGGSGLYIDAVCNGFHPLPSDQKLREHLEEELNTKGLAYMQNLLKEKSPEVYKSIDIKNTRRLLRALELSILTNSGASAIKENIKTARNFKIIKIGLTLDRRILYERINARVDEMVLAGLFEEAISLHMFRNNLALQTVGYKEIFDFLEGKITKERAIELIKQNTRNFAKRQATWFKRDKNIEWFEPDQKNEILNFIETKINFDIDRNKNQS